MHQNSRRRHHPFVAVSCALFSETLIESELFGHERGAFTGAIKDRPGRFEMAEGGTIFLDDIDDVPLSMQVKLLRVLQNRTVERLGGTRTIPVNVRVIAGTKRDLKQLVVGGKVPRGSLLPAERAAGDAAAASRAARGHPGADGALSGAVLPPAERGCAGGFRRGQAGVHAVFVARQRPRAGERVRTDCADLLVRDGARRLHVGEHSVPRGGQPMPALFPRPIATASAPAATTAPAMPMAAPPAPIDCDCVYFARRSAAGSRSESHQRGR